MQKIRIAAVGIMVALVATITGGSIAYFTSQTGSVDNVFTIGAVDVTVSQGAFDSNTGFIDPNNRVLSNKYGKVAGGDRVEIDPTITIPSGSVACYVFPVIKISKWNAMGMFNDRINGVNVYNTPIEEYVKSLISLSFEGFPLDQFEIMNMEEIVDQVLANPKPTYLTIVLGSKEPLSEDESIRLFSAIHPPVVDENSLARVNSFNTGSYKMYVTVYAIQSENLDPPTLEGAFLMATDVLGSEGIDFPPEYE